MSLKRQKLHFVRGFAFRTRQLQTGALAFSTELQYTENKFISNKFPSRWDGCLFMRSEK